MRATDIVWKALDHIGINYADSQISANMIADRLAITPQYFSKLFNEQVESSFPDYLMGVRLERARELLMSNPGRKIDGVARSVGLNNRTYFASAFKKRFGVSPAVFRRVTAVSSL